VREEGFHPPILLFFSFFFFSFFFFFCLFLLSFFFLFSFSFSFSFLFELHIPSHSLFFFFLLFLSCLFLLFLVCCWFLYRCLKMHKKNNKINRNRLCFAFFLLLVSVMPLHNRQENKRRKKCKVKLINVSQETAMSCFFFFFFCPETTSK